MKRTVAWLLPPLVAGSEHFRNVLRWSRALQLHGCENHLFFPEGEPAELARKCLEGYGAAGLKIQGRWPANGRFDAALATTWLAAFHARATLLGTRVVYVLQDWEADLTAMGAETLLAENAADLGLPTIAVSQGLAARANAGREVVAHTIDFGADPEIYRPLPPKRSGPPAVCFWYDSSRPQRCPLLGLDALRQLKQTLPFVEIVLFGPGAAPSFSFEATWLGALDPAKTNDLYNRCHAGLTLHATQLSRLPFEMLAAGLPVVDLHGQQTIHDLPADAARLAAPDARSIAAALLDVLANDEARLAMRRAGINFMATRTPAAEDRQFAEAVLACVAPAAPSAASAHPPKPSPAPLRYPHPALLADAPPSAIVTARRWSLVSYDVWDTLLRRRCHPDEVKLHTARYLYLKYAALVAGAETTPLTLVKDRVLCEQAIGQREQAGGSDDEYEINEVFRLWLARVCNRALTAEESATLAAELVAVEVAQERRVIYADPHIAALLARFDSAHRCFLSDFYMPAETLRELLLHAGYPADLAVGVSSCDARLNKRTGRLFELVQNHLKVAPGDHLHVGDNYYSDVYIPRKRGLHGLAFAPRAERVKVERFKQEFAQRSLGRDFTPDPLAAMGDVRAEQLDALPTDRAMFQLGVALAPLLTSFALALAEQAARRGLSRLYFFSREGEFFAEVYAALARHQPLGFPMAQPVVLEVSRLATFAASLRRFDTAEFMRLWNLYSTQSFRAFFVTLDLDPAPFAALLQQHGIPFAEPIRYPWLDARVARLLADPRFVEALARHAEEKRALLLAYLAERGLAADERQIGIVDIGWRGTIQDNFAHVLPQTKVHGFYLGMLPLLNEQPANVSKFSYGPGRKGDNEETCRLLDFVSPLEMLCNSRFGTTLRYRRDGDRVTAQRERDPREEAVFEAFTQHFQAGVLSQVGAVAEQIAQRALSSDDLRPLALKSLGQLVHNPPRAAAEAYFSLNHNETFGVGVFDDKKRYQAQQAEVRGLYENGEIEAFQQRLLATTWPQAYARLCGIAFPFFRTLPPRPAPITPAAHAAARRLGDEAFAHHRARDFARARHAALQSLAQDPWSLRLHHLAYSSALAANQSKAAMAHFRLIKKLQLTHGPTLNEFACRSHAMGLVENALSVFKTIVKDRPTYLPALSNLCRLHLASGQRAEAFALLRDKDALFKQRADYQEFKTLITLLATSLHLAELPAVAATEPLKASSLRDRTLALQLLQSLKPLTEPEKAALARFARSLAAPQSDEAYLAA